jgi:hypothetical protein
VQYLHLQNHWHIITVKNQSEAKCIGWRLMMLRAHTICCLFHKPEYVWKSAVGSNQNRYAPLGLQFHLQIRSFAVCRVGLTHCPRTRSPFPHVGQSATTSVKNHIIIQVFQKKLPTWVGPDIQGNTTNFIWKLV